MDIGFENEAYDETDFGVPVILPGSSRRQRYSANNGFSSDEGDEATHLSDEWYCGRDGQSESTSALDGYIANLRRTLRDMSVVRQELHYLCRHNLANKLAALCGVLHDYGHRLTSDELTGAVSESCLHAAVVHDSTNAALVLLRHGGQSLAIKQYTHPDYAGTTALHLAVIKRNKVLIDAILATVHNAEVRMKLLHKAANSKIIDKSRNAYFPSEVALNIAATIGDHEVLRMLIYHGADVGFSSLETGDNVLHSLANHEDGQLACRVLQFIVNMDEVTPLVRRKLLQHKNREEETPLMCAARSGNPRMCHTIMQIVGVYRFPQWQCVTFDHTFYELSEVDRSLLRQPRPALLDYVMHSEDSMLSLCDTEPMQTLLRLKWAQYSKLYAVSACLHFVVMLMCSYHISQTSLTHIGFSPYWVMRTAEICIMLSATIYLYGILDDVIVAAKRYQTTSRIEMTLRKKIKKLKVYFRPDGFDLSAAGYSVCVYFTAIMHCAYGKFPEIASNGGRHSVSESIVLSTAAICGWIYMLKFTRVIRNIGLFTVMIESVVVGDLMNFMVVYGLTIAGFSTCALALFTAQTGTHEGGALPEAIQTLESCIMEMFRLSFGLGEFDVLRVAPSVTVVRLMFCGFVLTINVQLMNTLIAAMNDTYACMATRSDKLIHRARGRAALRLESRLPYCVTPTLQLIKRYGPRPECRELHFLEVYSHL